MDYKKLYHILFNSITDTLKEIERSPVLTQETARGIKILKEAQKTTEDIYIESSKLKGNLSE